MKKTIAKIMAAAMLLTAIPAVSLDVNANSLDEDDFSFVTPSLVSSLDITQGTTTVATAAKPNVETTYSSTSPLAVSDVTFNYSTNGGDKGTIVSSIDTGINVTAAMFVKDTSKALTMENTYQDAADLSSSTKTASVDADDVDDMIYAGAKIEYADSTKSGFLSSYGVSVNQYGQIRLAAAANTKAQDVINNLGSSPAVVKLTLAVNPAFELGTVSTTNNTQAEIPNYVFWIKLGGASSSSTGADSTVYVELDYGKTIAVPVVLTNINNAAKTAEIQEADPNLTGENKTRIFTTDAVKGGTLNLDTVKVNGEDYNVTRIHARVFKGGKFKLVKATKAKRINNGAFRECKQLTKVILNDGNKIKRVDTKAFYKCKKLATVKIGGKSLKQVGKQAFGSTKSNIHFKVAGNKNQYNKAVKKIKKSGVPKKAKYSKI